MSKKLRQLQDRAAAILQEQAAINAVVDSEDRGENQFVMSEEEQARFDKLSNEFDQVEAAIGREKQLIERKKTLDEQAETTEERPAARIEPVNNTEQSGPFRTFGEQLAAIYASSSPGGSVDERLSQVQAAASGGSAGVPSDGGFLIQKEFSTDILQRTYELGTLAGACDRMSPGDNFDGIELPYVDETSRATGSRLGGVRVYRRGEADTVTASKPKIGKFQLDLEDLMGLAYATNRLLRDASVMDQFYRNAFAEEFAFVLDDEILRGSGVGQCLGILNADCAISTAKETGQAADTVVYKNLVKMWGNLLARYRTNAVWYINQEIEEQLNLMTLPVGTGGVPVYLPPGGASEAPYGRLFGRPVKPIEHCSAPGDVGDIVLGDLSRYLLIDKDGLQTDTSMHVRFIYDEMTFRFKMRVNGKPKDVSALTPYKGSSGKTYSAFTYLAAR
jgi:HK97 family phage major capsid protein